MKIITRMEHTLARIRENCFTSELPHFRRGETYDFRVSIAEDSSLGWVSSIGVTLVGFVTEKRKRVPFIRRYT